MLVSNKTNITIQLPAKLVKQLEASWTRYEDENHFVHVSWNIPSLMV